MDELILQFLLLLAAIAVVVFFITMLIKFPIHTLIVLVVLIFWSVYKITECDRYLERCFRNSSECGKMPPKCALEFLREIGKGMGKR